MIIARNFARRAIGPKSRGGAGAKVAACVNIASGVGRRRKTKKPGHAVRRAGLFGGQMAFEGVIKEKRLPPIFCKAYVAIQPQRRKPMRVLMIGAAALALIATAAFA